MRLRNRMKISRKRRQEEAKIRQAKRDKRTAKEQIGVLNARINSTDPLYAGAIKERNRLLAEIRG